jgi:hypothetical protein
MNAGKVFLILLLLASLALNVQQKFTAQYLVLVNDALIKDAQKPHPVHDAEITVWKREDGNLLIVVNGQFPHILRNPCANQRAL